MIRWGVRLTMLSLLAFAPAARAGDDMIAFGEYLAGECVTCHQLTGLDNGIPSITGWDKELFVRTLRAYQQKQRSHPVMQMVTAPLSDEEMQALAAYFGSLARNEAKGERFLE
jgi:cytochrome c